MRETYMSGEFIADKDYGNGVIGPSAQDLEAANSDRRDTGVWGNLIRRWKRPVGVLTAATTFLAVESVMAQQEFQAGDQVVVQFDANIRAGAGTNFADVGDVTEGQVYSILSIVKGTDGFDWYEIAFGKYVRGDKFKALEVVLTPFAPAPDATTPGTQTAEGSTTDANTTATADPTEIATAVQNGELIATPENVGFLVSGDIAPDPEIFEAMKTAMAAHPELLLPSIEEGEKSTITQNGQRVDFGLLSKEFLLTDTFNGFTKDIYNYLLVAKYKGYVDVPQVGQYPEIIATVYELKSKSGASFNIVVGAWTAHTTNPQELAFTLGTIGGNDAGQLNLVDVQTSDLLVGTMENPASVGQSVIIQALNNLNPIYGEEMMQTEEQSFAQLESALNVGSPFSTINTPRVSSIYVPEDIVVT